MVSPRIPNSVPALHIAIYPADFESAADRNAFCFYGHRVKSFYQKVKVKTHQSKLFVSSISAFNPIPNKIRQQKELYLVRKEIPVLKPQETASL